MHITNAAVAITAIISATVIICRLIYYMALPESLEAERLMATKKEIKYAD